MPPEKPALNLPNTVDLIDVSDFQAVVDYAKVAKAGFRGAIVRASLGPDYVDQHAARHLAGFRSVGMYGLVYGAAQPQKGEPRQQARKLLDGMGPIYTRCALDLETRGGLTNQQLVDFAEEFVQEIESFGAFSPMLYSYPYFEKGMQPELGASKLGRCPLWQAYYGGQQPWCPEAGDVPKLIPKPWDSAVMWQYSGGPTHGSPGGYLVPGVVGYCDRDLFLGDEVAFRKWMGLPNAA